MRDRYRLVVVNELLLFLAPRKNQHCFDCCDAPSTSGMGLVSRVTPVQTAMRNCTGDGGGPFEIGNQVLVSSHRKLLWSKAMVVSVAENRNEIPAGKIERGERKRTADEVSKAD